MGFVTDRVAVCTDRAAVGKDRAAVGTIRRELMRDGGRGGGTDCHSKIVPPFARAITPDN